MQTIRRHIPHTHDEAGQTIAEYSILIAAIAFVVFHVLPYLGSAVAGLFSGAVASLKKQCSLNFVATKGRQPSRWR